MSQQISHFEELKLVPGQKMQLEIDSHTKIRGDSILIGYRADRAILVTTPVSNGAPVSVKIGTSTAVRFFANQANSVCAFRTDIIHVTQAIFPHFFLAAPLLIEVGEVRKATRAKVVVPCSIFLATDGKPQHGSMLDLSVDGARISCGNLGSKITDQFNIIVKIQILGLDKIMKIPCIVRSITENGTGKFYGVQFTNTKNDDKIAMHAFVMSNV